MNFDKGMLTTIYEKFGSISGITIERNSAEIYFAT
jgi:hypothetical protein